MIKIINFIRKVLVTHTIFVFGDGGGALYFHALLLSYFIKLIVKALPEYKYRGYEIFYRIFKELT